ncbi:MAG TPA: FecR domain-containing protein [Gemmatimonadales bacterium]|nr:FecR domain-containing protein [Gemmatimonadales bacterium]
MSTRSIVRVIALAALAAGRWSPAESSEWPLRIVTVAGQAELSKGSPLAWTAAALRAELGPGAATRTLQGWLTLRTTSGQEVRLAPRSRISLPEGGGADQPTLLRMDAGSVWVAVMPGSSPREQFEVQAVGVTVTVRGSGVGITLGQDGSALVRVYHGAAECAGPGAERQWTRVLADGQELRVSSAGRPEDTRKFTRDKLDADWVKWNEEQDVAGGYGGKLPER